MKEKGEKKTGYTLVEVILSVALIALLLIPISNMIMTALKSSKRADIRQEGAVIGQQVLEELKTFETITADPLGNFQLLDGTMFEKQGAGDYNSTITAGNQRYQVEIKVEEDENFKDYMVGDTSVSEKDDLEYSSILNFTNENGNNILQVGTDKKELNGIRKILLLVKRESENKLNIGLYNYPDTGADTTNPLIKKTITGEAAQKNRIKILIDKSFADEINAILPIIIDNDKSTGLNVDIVKDKSAAGKISISSSLANSPIIIDGSNKQPSPETFTANSNIKIQTAEDKNQMGNLQKVTITVKNNGEEIFKSEVSNNLN